MTTKNLSYSAQSVIDDQYIDVFFMTLRSTMKVHVLKNTPISTLFSLLPNSKKIVFFDGLVIHHHKTFSELSIESFSRFVILDGENISSNQMCFWKKVTLRDDESREQFQLI
jgi:hypothetical protein